MTKQGTPLPGIRVFATAVRLYSTDTVSNPADAFTRYEATADSTGVYSLHGLPDGEYTVRTGPDERYSSQWTTVRAGIEYADLVLEGKQTVYVEGQVLSSDGYPLEGVVVLPAVLGVSSVTTDGGGYYRLPVDMAQSGSGFLIRFQSPGFKEESVRVTTRHQATDAPRTVNVVMTTVSEWTAVTGVVTSPDGSAVSSRIVQLRPMGENRVYSARTNDEGEFLFSAVEAGRDYALQVTGAPDHEDYRERVRITVDNADFDIVVEPYRFGRVIGQMVNLDGSPIPNFSLSLRHTMAARPSALVTSDGNGRFAIELAPAGELVFSSRSTPSVLVRGIQLEPGGTAQVPMVLDWGEHEIRGLVLDRYGKPAPASRVVLKWAHEQGGIRTASMRRTAADAQGHFLFSAIGPGTHRLEIDAPGHRPVTLNHDASRAGYDLVVRLN